MPKQQGQKVFQCERWVEFSETWPTSGTMRNGRLSPLEQSELRTSESESSSSRSLPTPQARDWKGSNPNRQGGDDLPTAVLKLLPTPSASDATGGGAHPSKRVGHSRQIIDAVLTYGEPIWDEYQPAIDRWEGMTRPAPNPTELGTKGNPRLRAEFSEWMMGWPEGWVTDLITDRRGEGISRSAALKMIGNGVCVQQAASAIRDLLA
ncbi:DNA methyltransferase [Mycobacterium phage Noelle]|uniref:DNA methylase n=1 Tax=Mycobacterium phage Noelle TaxID=2572317 RepID=A0A6B9LAC6_9CAUD|nr:DNA methyltransferase [Mycobacterium phage Noelle]QHB38103.1 DNA methylase [Mycobacterium phage Noelle]